jgi:hypothetical protein
MKYLRKFNEKIGPKFASMAFKPKFDERTERVKKEAITSMFSSYINKDLPFFIKTLKSNDPTKYKLIEVEFSDYFIFHFYNEEGPDSDAPYANGKREILFKYSIDLDKYDQGSTRYLLNSYIVNFLIKSANEIREFYFNVHPIKIKSGEIDVESTNLYKKSKLTKDDFNMFSYDSKNLLNR